MLLKPNQRGTLTETMEAWQAAKECGFAGIVSARSGETEDTTIVHLAVGWGVGQLKVGSFARGERMAKWNEALRIEEALRRARALRRRRRCWGEFGCGGGRTTMKVLFHYAAGTGPRGTAGGAARAGDRRSARRTTSARAAPPPAGDRRAVARAEAVHCGDDRGGTEAEADPEDRHRRQHDRPGGGEGARHSGVQPARHQFARGGGADAGD